VVCSREGQISVPGKNKSITKGIIIPKGYEGNLNCPNPNEFCVTKALQYCPRGCMGRGTCINGRCVCNEGYDGDSCSYRVIFLSQTLLYFRLVYSHQKVKFSDVLIQRDISIF